MLFIGFGLYNTFREIFWAVFGKIRKAFFSQSPPVDKGVFTVCQLTGNMDNGAGQRAVFQIASGC